MTGEGGIVVSCHCGDATIRADRAPDLVMRCNCSLCTKSGWQGVYYASDELSIAGDFDSYVRSDLDQPMIRMLRCARCGILTHWEPLTEPPHERMGINARLIDPALLDDVEVRDADGANWER